MHACYTTFLVVQCPPKGHSSLFLQLQDSTFGFLSLVVSSLSSLLLWLLTMLYIFLVQEFLIFTVFLLKILPNGLSLLKCLSRTCRKSLPILMLVSLQNGGINQITFLFLFFHRLFPWLLLLIISPTLKRVRVPPLLFLALELRSTGIKYSSLPWNPLSFRASSYLLLFSSKVFLHEDSLLILWFTALGICLILCIMHSVPTSKGLQTYKITYKDVRNTVS